MEAVVTVSDHLNTVRAMLELLREIEGKTASEEVADGLAALDAIEAAYDQRDKAFLDLLELNADKEAREMRLRAELGAAREVVSLYWVSVGNVSWWDAEQKAKVRRALTARGDETR